MKHTPFSAIDTVLRQAHLRITPKRMHRMDTERLQYLAMVIGGIAIIPSMGLDGLMEVWHNGIHTQPSLSVVLLLATPLFFIGWVRLCQRPYANDMMNDTRGIAFTMALFFAATTAMSHTYTWVQGINMAAGFLYVYAMYLLCLNEDARDQPARRQARR